jgi:hypothetical protein
MTEPRLKTDLWIRAQIRLCDVSFIPAVIGRKGDPDAGQVLIRRDLLNGTCELFARTVLADGGRGWRRLGGRDPLDREEADALVTRECGIDPDLWVLEIDDPDRRYTLDAPTV